MQTWIKTLLGSGKLEELPEEFAKLLAQAKRDREALEKLLKPSLPTWVRHGAPKELE
jgi:hypothetical protein